MAVIPLVCSINEQLDDGHIDFSLSSSPGEKNPVQETCGSGKHSIASQHIKLGIYERVCESLTQNWTIF